MDVATSVMVQLEVLCQYLTEVTQRVSSGNNGRMNGRKLLKENICNIFFSLLVFVCFVSCVYTFFALIYKFVPLSVFVSVSFVQFSGCNNVRYVNYIQSSLLSLLLQCLNK